MNIGQLYYGFGYQIDIGDSNNFDSVYKSSLSFQSFVLSLMKFYGIDYLLMFGGKVDKYLVVHINVNKNRVVTITSLETGIGLSIGKKCDIINVFDLELSKKQKSVKKH